MPRTSLIDIAKLNEQLETILASHGHDLEDARLDIIKSLKFILDDGRKAAEAQLLDNGQGLKCAQNLSTMMDEIIKTICVTAFKYGENFKAIKPEKDLSIIAVGGYGRGTLAPGSDIDLLFLLPEGNRRSENFTEFVLYILWDLGLKVGHSVRNISECISNAQGDSTIATTLLEMRGLWGSKSLARELDYAFKGQVVAGTSSQYIEIKLQERSDRLKKNGASRYMVEPNVKEGKGGLRDINTLFWIAQYHYGIKYARELVKLGVLTQTEFSRFRKASDFLWAVRCHMHFEARRAEEHLHFEIQREIAKRLGYTDREGQRGVERFMKHYFLVAKDVGDLTRVICAALELEEAKSVPLLGAVLNRVSRRQKPIKGTDFVIESGRIRAAHDEIFKDDPVNFIRMFHLADKHTVHYHPATLQLVSRSLKLINRKVQNDPEANQLFVDLLSSKNNPAYNLRRMNEAGVLGKFVPEFGKIVAMMQFSMYHSYTVDEHTIRAVGVYSALEKEALMEEHPLAATLIQDIRDNRRLLYVALFLHDIAKGRPEDHSIAGARVAKKLCPRFGFSKADTETIAWLIEQHLTMSNIAQSRDLNDRKTIDDFGQIVQSRTRLKLLLFLTICDIRAVGPNVWNGWKGQLLRTLYHETELLITGGFSAQARDARAAMARDNLVAALENWPDEKRIKYAALFYDYYLLGVPLEDQLRHAEFINNADENGLRLTSDVRTNAFEGITEITVLAPDHPRLLSSVFAACSGAGANIVDAHIYTTTDGRGLDTILITRAFERDEDEYRRGRKIGQLIEDVVSGKASLPETAKRQKKQRGAAAFSIVPKVIIHNDLSNRFSVIEIECLDRAGLLSDITGKLSALSLDVKSAQITTFGEKVIDNFYVTDLVGSKIINPQRQKKIIATLLDVIDRKKQQKAV